jgi:uncharacterized protein (TIGR02246 family)
MSELEDTLAVARLVNAYAQAVDRRDAAGAAGLFAEDGILVVDSTPGEVPPAVIEGRDAIARALEQLSRYNSTFHEITSHTVELGPRLATAQTGCVAHHITGPAGEERDRVWFVNYFDDLICGPDGWRFARRELRVEIVQERPLILE